MRPLAATWLSSQRLAQLLLGPAAPLHLAADLAFIVEVERLGLLHVPLLVPLPLNVLPRPALGFHQR